MTRAVSALRAAPITVPCLVVGPLLLWWAADGAGYPVARWVPGLLLVLCLLAVAVVVVPNAWGDVARPVLISAGLLAAFTVWSYATIAWAGDPGSALEGANRTLLYAALFCLFALWRQRPGTAAALVTGWTLAIVALAAVTTLRLALVTDPTRLFSGDRLGTPVSYPNAAAATFAMALWPAVVLAGSRRVHPLARGASAGGAVLLVGLALLAQSRGAALAIPLTGLLCLALVPGRLRTLGALAAVAAGAALGAPKALDVADTFTGGDPAGAIGSAARALLVGGAVVAVIVAAVAAWERARPPGARVERAVTRTAQVLAGLGVLAALAIGVAAGPTHRLDDAWHSFKGGYDENDATAVSRLTGGLGSNRYDFYRVALHEFSAAPLAGRGGDNFQQAYLRRGRSDETPRYPHSFELRTLSQTGLVGAVLLLGALLAAGWAAFRGMRPRGEPAERGLAAAAGGAALVGAAYVFVHGSADWFWETAGLSAPAFALLGLAAGLAPRAQPAHPRMSRARGPIGLVAVGALLLYGLVAAAAPWLADRETERAAGMFATRPLAAYAHLDRAASLDPFSDRPALLEGSIAERYNDLPRADAAFGRALRRNPDGQYATLQRGALASARGDQRSAELLLARAVALAPRDPTSREALKVVRSGGRVDLGVLAQRIFSSARELSG